MKRTMFALVMIGITLSVFPQISQAQCPDSTDPDPGPAWVPHSEYILIPGTNCHETVTFCDRWNPIENEFEMYITSVTPNPGDTCSDPQVLIEGAFNFFVNNGAAPEDLSLPPCQPGPGAVVRTYLLRCWKIKYNDPIPGDFTYYACPGDISCTAPVRNATIAICTRIL